MELAPLGIYATVVAPGFFRTEFLREKTAKFEKDIEDWYDVITRTDHDDVRGNIGINELK